MKKISIFTLFVWVVKLCMAQVSVGSGSLSYTRDAILNFNSASNATNVQSNYI